LLNIMIAPFGRVQFRDFFLADILTSLVDPLADVAYAVCFTVTGQFLHSDYTGNCATIRTYYLAIIIWVIPIWFRFAQCLKKYYLLEQRTFFPHLVNAGKYFTGVVAGIFNIVYVTAYVGFNPATSHWGALFIVYVAARIVYSLYAFGWDIIMDWGLGERKCKNWLLRENLLVNTKYIYYAIMVFDLFGRLFWIIGLFNYYYMYSGYWLFITSFVELFRRSVWAFFRVENESLHNYENYRTIDLPVPPLGYTHKKAQTDTIPSSGPKPKNAHNHYECIINSVDDTVSRELAIRKAASVRLPIDSIYDEAEDPILPMRHTASTPIQGRYAGRARSKSDPSLVELI